MSGQQTARLTVLALLGNLTVAVAKFAAFALSGSSAMLAEGLHSSADTVDAALLWVGVRLSSRPPDARHPFGYGAERYFWSFVSAVGVFMLVGGATIYQAIERLLHPRGITINFLTWCALGLGALLDGGVLVMSVREANHRRRGRSWGAYLRASTDPTLLAVLFEDVVDLLGVVLAAVGVGLTHAFGAVWFDATASLAIGCLMVVLALGLAQRNRLLLIGAAAAPEVERRIREVLVSDPAVGKVLGLRTRVLAADVYRVDLQVDLNPDAIVERLRPEIRSAAASIVSPADLEVFARAFARRVVDELAHEVDRIEASIREVVPGARVIDVEGD
jgi:zinc transporter 9